MGNNKKRKRALHAQEHHDTVAKSNDVGVGSTLARLRDGDHTTSRPNNEEQRSDSEGWTVVGKGGRKKQKMNNYPSLIYSELHRLSSSVNIHQLQGLLLYCLADGTSQQFVSVQHHGMVQKAVVLFVPGLEKGMFDGSIQLEAPPEEDLMDLSNLEEIGANGQTKPEENLIMLSPIRGSMNGSTEDLIDFSEPRNAADGLTIGAASYAQHVANVHSFNEAPVAHVHNPSAVSPDAYLPTQLSADKLPVPLKPLADTFVHLWPVKAPGDERQGKVHSPLHAMLNSPITKTQEEKREDKQIKGPKPAREGKYWENKRTPIAHFIAGKEELYENDFTLHPAWFTVGVERSDELERRARNKQAESDGWVNTVVETLEDGIVPDKDIQQGSLTAGRRVLAMDCEMCKVQGDETALTRISLVNWDGEIVMDELVMPDKPIADYLTLYSGITPEKLRNIRTTLQDIQDLLVKTITPKHILVGHSLNSDLTALKLTHPFIIDTSILYPHPRGPPMKSSLKWLAQKYLNREIQKGHGTVGHDSIEDAKACLDLVKLKCERGPQWGTSEATSESIFKRLKRAPKVGPLIDSGDGKTGAIVDHGAPERNFGSMATYCIGCSDDAGVVEGVKRAVLGDSDGKYIPGGGVDLTWARFQELAAMRGWLLDHRPGAKRPAMAEPEPAALGAAVAKTVNQIKEIRDFLPPCTLLIVYSGTGDPREIGRLQEMQRTFKKEFQAKKWDQLSVKWTDTEEQALKMACRRAREGLGFIAIT
ncbi:RNA exonuclease, partial [Lecanoromycetidae sp. Uapishka_2]